MDAVRRRFPAEVCRSYARSSRLEWILTNGIGGYAMGTVAGVNTRRYHGLLVAATEPPAERMVLLAALEMYATVAGEQYGLSANQYVGTVHPEGYRFLDSFESGSAVEWVWTAGPTQISRRVTMDQGQNAVRITHRNLGSEAVTLSLRPLVSHKFYHDNFRVTDFYPDFLFFPEDRTIIQQEGIRLVIDHPMALRVPTTGWYYRFEHTLELERGLDPLDDLFCPCELQFLLGPGESASVTVADREDFTPFADAELGSRDDSVEASLKSAARHFLVKTENRTSIIAGYPWFTDWGRDTMISLPGLALAGLDPADERNLLSAYAGQMNQGLIPNRFADTGDTPAYNTVDGSLWFANGIYHALMRNWDDEFAHRAHAWLCDIIEWHRKGTLFGIHVDAQDGLLSQGSPGIQLTWMDVKFGDWVVTPRHGKPVEINGLWINLLKIAMWLAARIDKSCGDLGELAELAGNSMNAKFWHPMVGHFLDTAEPDDASLRPNQLIAMSLPFAPLGGENAKLALAKIERELLTPMGLRTLGPKEPHYSGRFEGPIERRDAAYHQGTVWPWLFGPYVDAVLKVTGDRRRAQAALTHIVATLDTYGIDGIAEVYDGDAPQYPGGCPWQAWSVAEVLRAWRACHDPN